MTRAEHKHKHKQF